MIFSLRIHVKTHVRTLGKIKQIGKNPHRILKTTRKPSIQATLRVFDSCEIHMLKSGSAGVNAQKFTVLNLCVISTISTLLYIPPCNVAMKSCQHCIEFAVFLSTSRGKCLPTTKVYGFLTVIADYVMKSSK